MIPDHTIRINITGAGRALVRVTCTPEDITLESNLGEHATSAAIATAMEQMARSVGQLDNARREVARLRALNASMHDMAKAIAQMISEMFAGASVLDDVDIDLRDWRPEPAEN